VEHLSSSLWFLGVLLLLELAFQKLNQSLSLPDECLVWFHWLLQELGGFLFLISLCQIPDKKKKIKLQVRMRNAKKTLKDT
jgi:hypothetical protein